MRNVVVDPATDALIKAVRDASAKHQVYANNIANAYTPGYKPQRLPEDMEKVNAQKALGIEDKIVIEEELGKDGEVVGKRESYIRLISLKRSIVTQIIRQGK